MPYIHLKNNSVEYEFVFKQKYLFIRGDSGIGKSSLLTIIDEMSVNPDAVDCIGDSNLIVMHSIEDLKQNGNVIFLDENSRFLWMAESAKLFNESDNYFVIITRARNLDSFKSGLDSLVYMVTDGDKHIIKQCYPRKDKLECIGECIVCEDKKSGFQFLQQLVNYPIESAESKNKFGVKLKKLRKQSYTIVYDRCGICFAYENQMNYLKNNDISIVSEIDWDSFESYILEYGEYGIKVPWYPDKERNAVRLFKEIIDKSYDKSYLPKDIKIPIVWKIAELKRLVEHKKSCISSMNSFGN